MALLQRDRRRLGGDDSLVSVRLVVATAVVVLIAAAALVLLVTRPEPAAPPVATPGVADDAVPATPPVAAPDGLGSMCGLPDGDQVVPVTDPGTQWELVGTMAAPAAPEVAGPGVVEGGLRSCFARTPTGALYAAANFLTTASDPALRLPAAERLTAAGPGRDQAIALLQEASESGRDPGVQIAGYSFLAYNVDEAIVDLAMSTTGPLAHLPLTMRWEAGDWKAVVPADGEPFDETRALPSLAGYVPWTGA